MIENSLKIVKEYSIQHNIDQSHNEHHSKEVLFWALDILERDPQPLFPKQELEIIIQSCILHDLIDAKYLPNPSFVINYLSTLHPPESVDIIMKIMDTMSYSKIYKNGRVEYPEWILNSSYGRAFHVVREADLLSSYNIARMIEYRQAQQMSQDDIKEEIHELYKNRMSCLIENNHFVHNQSRARAEQLDALARIKLSTVRHHPLTDLGYFRFVDYLIGHELADRFTRLSL
jgi:HD superfamily phosphodiesterase